MKRRTPERSRATLSEATVRAIISIVAHSTPAGVQKSWSMADKRRTRQEDRDLAKRFDVIPETVRTLRTRRSWTHIWNEMQHAN